MEPFSFSPELINRTIAYYMGRGESISPETAQEYLRDLSSLYGALMAFVDVREGKAAAASAAPSHP